ncbi:MAG: hypothetical protein A2V70_03950 [Planctomycetes bacterium RBG_13_63_9]|nr:MAG: hypothetical protein A2V70_03950 [Planctomycetes bacterium RBG_13_63_9]
MPRRNLFLLMAAAVVSLLCYHNVQNNRYGRVLVDAMEQIELRYLEPIDQKKLFEGAMEGMVGRLDDPYSSFESPEDLQRINEALDQQFGGVGIEVHLDDQTRQLTVASPIAGGPAYEAGIRAGDRILRIDGKSTQGLSLGDAVDLMRGKPGEPVNLSIQHEGEDEPLDVTIVRAMIHVDTVLGDRRNSDGSWDFFLEGHDRIGYVRVGGFGVNTASELRRTVQSLTDRAMQGLILDLRDNPGGLLEAAVDVCNLFIDEGVIVTTRRRDGSIKNSYIAKPQDTFGDFPMAVLVNQYSASASEIVAACLQDYGRAVVVGQRSWGKGTVQEVIGLEGEHGALKLTTASYWRPSGRNIHRRKDAAEDQQWGVTPDPEYELTVEGKELDDLRLGRRQRDVFRPAVGDQPSHDNDNDSNSDNNAAQSFVDPQLAEAVEYLEKAIAQRAKP